MKNLKWYAKIQILSNVEQYLLFKNSQGYARFFFLVFGENVYTKRLGNTDLKSTNGEIVFPPPNGQQKWKFEECYFGFEKT